jgi:hypothetical protein
MLLRMLLFSKSQRKLISNNSLESKNYRIKNIDTIKIISINILFLSINLVINILLSQKFDKLI